MLEMTLSNNDAMTSSWNTMADFEPSASVHFSTSSSFWTSQLSEVSSPAATSSPSFDAVPPDTTTLIGMGTVFVLCVIAAFVWNNSVVPVSRTKLAISKSRGEVKEYLEELQQGATINGAGIVENIDNTTTTTTTATADASGVVEGEEQQPPQIEESTSSSSTDGRDFERWLFADWLDQRERKGGRQKEPALPILKDAKWNSGDNPVVVTSAIMLVGVVVASVTERVIQ